MSSTTQTITSQAPPTLSASTSTPSHPAPGSLLTSHSSHQAQVDSLDRVSYLFGTPIAHSLSPIIHQEVYRKLSLNWGYFLHESDSIPSFLALTQTPKFFGAAVTMPHKVAIIPHLDELTAEGRAVGAINTVFLSTFPDGRRKLIGTNTDTIGVREALRQNVSAEKYASFKGKAGLIIGGGGTSRAAVYALKHFIGCSSVYFINRDPTEVSTVIAECTAAGFGQNLIHVRDEAHALTLAKPAVIVSAVPNFPPKTPAEIEARKCVEVMLRTEPGIKKGALLEMCYHPSSDTEIARLATKMGWPVVEGTEAMIYQGLEQDRMWTGSDTACVDVSLVKGLVREAIERGH